jgi:hypothetical protein
MNDEQKLWWDQAKSDHAVFVLLRRAGVHECHMLHYFQMAAEIDRAYRVESDILDALDMLPSEQEMMWIDVALFDEASLRRGVTAGRSA